MNFYSGIDKKIQFHFLQASIRPRKRYSKWMKNTKMKYLEDVKTYYGYSNRKAKEAIGILSKQQLENIPVPAGQGFMWDSFKDQF